MQLIQRKLKGKDCVALKKRTKLPHIVSIVISFSLVASGMPAVCAVFYRGTEHAAAKNKRQGRFLPVNIVRSLYERKGNLRRGNKHVHQKSK